MPSCTAASPPPSSNGIPTDEKRRPDRRTPRSRGDPRAAFDWHMRAAAWSNHRDLAAARASWRRARQVADRLPAGDPTRLSMRIAPRTLLCGTALHGAGASTTLGSKNFTNSAPRPVISGRWPSEWPGG